MPEDEAALIANIISLARQYDRYGYHRIDAQTEGRWLGH
jgi:hypothetical protein